MRSTPEWVEHAMAPDTCPTCDAEVPPGARACPECGADEATGWSESAHCDRLGIPDPDAVFDHGESVRAEFGGGENKPARLRALWLITAIILLAALLRWLL